MKYYQTKQTGFSLVETLVAISILLIVITGPLITGITAVRSTNFSSEQVVAFFLAQEGAELIQKARDDLLLDYFVNPTLTPWTTFSDTVGLYEACFLPTGCGLELQPVSSIGALQTPVHCLGIACQLYYNATGDRARYTHQVTGNVKTKYSRVIKLTEMAGGDVQVRSTVTWREGSRRVLQQVEVETYLFDVYGY